uniref:Pilus assembly protein n=1 Tax=Acidobacterium capsulatum TaxID=33075 RepID=A0A7V5CS00_9BACT
MHLPSPGREQRSLPGARPRRAGALCRETEGQSLLETAVMMVVMTLLIIYSVDYGYFFIVAANLTSAARNAAEFSIQGYQSPGQQSLPTAGPPNSADTVAALALADLGDLAKSTTVTTITVCSKQLGTSNNYTKCATYNYTGGSTPYSTTTTTATEADPEAPTFYLNRVDVTYKVQPPIPISLFGANLVPSTSFHRAVVMRAED